MAIGVPIALVDALIGSGGKTWPDAWGGPKVNAITTAWHGAILGIGAYLILYLLLPAILVRLALAFTPSEYLAALLADAGELE